MKTQSRSIHATLQLGIAGLGAVVILGSLAWGTIVVVSMPSSESGFAEGLAVLIALGWVVVGFVVLAGGLSIPQRGTGGLPFTRRQRTLLAYGVVAPTVAVASIPIVTAIGPPLSEPVRSVAVAGLVLLLLSGPLATLTAVIAMLRNR